MFGGGRIPEHMNNTICQFINCNRYNQRLNLVHYFLSSASTSNRTGKINLLRNKASVFLYFNFYL